jgi:flavin reductase (DIM6/NTAB) family NADH-FMN oxidoreductase RutF
MSVDPEGYKQAARMFASGVTIVAVSHDGSSHGMTASSFASVSLEPPLILVSLEKSSRTRELLLESGRFAVNILAEDQQEIARAFAHPGDKTFDHIEHHTNNPGAPFLSGSIAMLACTTEQVVPGGDHDIFIGEVTAVEVNEGAPLVYFDRGYRSLGGD